MSDWHPVHDEIVSLVSPVAGEVLIDLGTGPGGTLAAAVHREPGVALVGLDLSVPALATAAARLAGRRVILAVADLARPLPIASAAVHIAVCHNVLELVADPAVILAEMARILRPGGRALISHTDFASLIVHGADPGLTILVCHAYAHVAQPWMANIDPYRARTIPALVRRSPLRYTAVHGHTVTEAGLTGQALRRVDEITAVTRDHATTGRADIKVSDVQRWREQLEQAHHHGTFFFAETVVLVTAAASG